MPILKTSALPRLRGIGAAYQHALVDTLGELVALPGLDGEIVRRAQWLKWGLEGHRPEGELLRLANAPPLVPGFTDCIVHQEEYA